MWGRLATVVTRGMRWWVLARVCRREDRWARSRASPDPLRHAPDLDHGSQEHRSAWIPSDPCDGMLLRDGACWSEDCIPGVQVGSRPIRLCRISFCPVLSCADGAPPWSRRTSSYHRMRRVMDEHDFDDLTRAIVGTRSRRSMLRRL